MSEKELRDLLHGSVEEPPHDLDADALLATAGRRQANRRLATGGAVAVLAGAVGLSALWMNSPHGIQAVPANSITATTSKPMPTEGVTSAATGTTAACPVAATYSPGTGVMVDWVDVVWWTGTDFMPKGTISSSKLGEPVGTVLCNVLQISKGGKAEVPLPWIDGTATFLPVGTVLYSVKDQIPACAIAVKERDGKVREYRPRVPRPCPTVRVEVPSSPASGQVTLPVASSAGTSTAVTVSIVPCDSPRPGATAAACASASAAAATTSGK